MARVSFSKSTKQWMNQLPRSLQGRRVGQLIQDQDRLHMNPESEQVSINEKCGPIQPVWSHKDVLDTQMWFFLVSPELLGRSGFP